MQKRSRRMKLGALATGFTVALLLAMATFAPATAARGRRLYYHLGYSIQGNWLCYGWRNGVYRCTQHWYRSGGRFVSRNRSWVPSQDSTLSARSNPTRPAAPPASSGGRGLSLRTRISQWGRTGYAAYTAWWGGDGYAFGNCTAGARFLSGNHIPTGLGNAANWANAARARGMSTGYTPRVGATVVFSPGVQGASSIGHVGHVVGVYANGWFMMAAENDYFDGGGFNRIDYRYAHSGAGVQFIY